MYLVGELSCWRRVKRTYMDQWETNTADWDHDTAPSSSLTLSPWHRFELQSDTESMTQHGAPVWHWVHDTVPSSSLTLSPRHSSELQSGIESMTQLRAPVWHWVHDTAPSSSLTLSPWHSSELQSDTESMTQLRAPVRHWVQDTAPSSSLTLRPWHSSELQSDTEPLHVLELAMLDTWTVPWRPHVPLSIFLHATQHQQQRHSGGASVLTSTKDWNKPPTGLTVEPMTGNVPVERNPARTKAYFNLSGYTFSF